VVEIGGVDEDEFVRDGPPPGGLFANVDVGLRTARVTMDASDGPPGLAPGAVAWPVVVPGNGGNWGGESVVGDDCLSARTDGGGWKLGVGLGRTLGRYIRCCN
jgi:hypothetical protein